MKKISYRKLRDQLTNIVAGDNGQRLSDNQIRAAHKQATALRKSTGKTHVVCFNAATTECGILAI